MKKILKKLKKVQKQISEKRSELNATRESNYYGKIAPEWHRKRDMNEIEREIKDLLNLELTTLESLQIAVNLKIVDNQSDLRRLIYQINREWI